MNDNRVKSPTNTKTLIRIYVAVVGAVFFGLMITLFRQTPNQPEAELMVEDDEIIAIIEEYRKDEVSRVSVSIADIETVLPELKVPAWRQNAISVAVSAASGPRIAVIIDDLGLSSQATEQLARMEGPYTLAYLPYAEELPSQTSAVRQAGHELMVHLPMQSRLENADPGKNALLQGLSFEEFGKRMEWNLSRFSGYVGINNHMGSLITEDPTLMVRLMARLRRDGLLYVDSLTTPKSVGRRAAKALGVPFTARDVFLDNEQDRNYINKQLETVEKIARLRGYAIAIGHPYVETLEALAAWRQTLAFKGLQLVPISQIMSEITVPENSVQSRQAASAPVG